MTRIKQIQTAFPDHWLRIWECMCPRIRGNYLASDADPAGAAWTLRGAFDWQRTTEGYAHWAKLAREAERAAASQEEVAP